MKIESGENNQASKWREISEMAWQNNGEISKNNISLRNGEIMAKSGMAISSWHIIIKSGRRKWRSIEEMAAKGGVW
jgi:U3 small nucleolar ribonucleoprotein component